MNSPYQNISVENWKEVTQKLIKEHPLTAVEIKEVVENCWSEILDTQIGSRLYKIGKDIFPKPQIMGFFLHELIQLEFERRYPNLWRKEWDSRDKDIVYIPDNKFSIEIKTSSNPSKIFGNRSYAQEVVNGKKSKSGYYLAINFEKFSEKVSSPRILKIRFGWLDHEDWMGQKAASGQQSRLSSDVEKLKLLQIV